MCTGVRSGIALGDKNKKQKTKKPQKPPNSLMEDMGIQKIVSVRSQAGHLLRSKAVSGKKTINENNERENPTNRLVHAGSKASYV